MARIWSTQRLIVRQLTPSDTALACDYGTRTREYHRPWDPVRSADYWEPTVVASRIAAELEQANQGTSLALYLFQAADQGRVIGRIALNNIVRGAFLSCSVGYGLAPEATGRGYMTEALEQVVRVAFEELHLHRVEANVIPRNERSIAVAERCGFEREGVSPGFLKIAGRWEDHLRMARRNTAMDPAE